MDRYVIVADGVAMRLILYSQPENWPSSKPKSLKKRDWRRRKDKN
jgi:hypothetical protein